jgi:hypothetical protein
VADGVLLSGLPESLREYRKIRDTLNPLFHPLLSGFAQIAAKGKENRHVSEEA